MSIGKSRNSDIDINSLMNEIDNENQVNTISADIDKRLAELKAANKRLQETTDELRTATIALDKATTALHSAVASSDNIVSGICKAIVEAQHNTVFEAKIIPKHLEQLQNLTSDFLTKEEESFETHRAKQEQQIESYEKRIKDMLIDNDGIWFSSFWLKVLCIVIIAFVCMVFLYVYIKT